ncbi:MAG: Ig-like domain-containing protein [bacterium]
MKKAILGGIALLLSACVQPDVSDSASGPNSNPIIKSLTADPPRGFVGRIVTLTVEAEDPDGDELSYSWFMTAGDVYGEGPVVSYVVTYCCVGINSVTVTVKDGRGGTATKIIDVEVRG